MFSPCLRVSVVIRLAGADVTVDEDKARAVLGLPELAWLVTRLRRRYEQGRGDAAAPLVLQRPSPAQREACDRLLGRRPTQGGSLAVRIDQLERIIVEAQIAPSLRDAIETLTGPLVDLHAQRQRTQAAWRRLFERLRPLAGDRPPASAWYDQVCEGGLLRRLAEGDLDRAAALLEQAVRVVSRLPAGGVMLAQLAAECCGDSHALDAGQPVGTLAVRAAARIGDVDLGPAGAGRRRRAWDGVGVICDELSAPVLTLNLPGACHSLTSELLRLCAGQGEPCRVTARQLLRHPPTFDAAILGGAVYLCENPSVVAAAAEVAGAGSRPLICLDGQPTTAVRLLLDALRQTGVVLRYHGDFDWGGLRIANRVVIDHGCEPWRMSADDYLAAAADGGHELKGTPIAAVWDPDLSPAMMRRRIAVHEERVLATLLGDLAKV